MGVWSYLVQPLVTAQADAGATEDVSFDTDVKSSNWDGGDDLSGGKDGTATAGYLIDFETGAAQFQAVYTEGGSIGALDIVDTLTLLPGGLIRTAASGTRVQIADVTASPGIEFYNGAASEDTAATIWGGTGYAPSATSFVGLSSGFYTGGKKVQLTLYGALSGQDSRAVLDFCDDLWVTNKAGTDTLTLDKNGLLTVDDVTISTGDLKITVGNATITAGDLTVTAGAIQLGALGSAAAPAVGLGTNYDDGMYSRIDSELSFTTAGVERVRITNTRTTIPSLYNDTTTTAANVVVSSSGVLKRSTSARKYKTDEHPAPALADIRLDPVMFTDLEGVRRVGQIADDLADQNPMLGTYNDDGAIEDFDMKAWAAVVAAKLNRLEEAVSW